MADRPIIFSGPMVQALLAGRKSQTRRVLTHACDDAPAYVAFGQVTALDENDTPYRWPRTAAVGDRLYVRENWSGKYYWHETPPRDRQSGCWGGEIHIKEDVWYWADGSPEYGDWEKPRPSIHMPRWASRLTLTVTDVRVQRLQDISEADAVAEGCDAVLALTIKRPNGAHPGNPRECYCDLWNSLHGHGAWDANPWVVAVTFTVQRWNIDQIGDANG